MEQFKQIIDTYILNYETYKNGKVEFECDYGELIFFKKNNNFLTLFGIYIFPEYRQKGFCRDILQYLIQSGKNFKYLCVQSVMSKILYNYLLRFNYENKKFRLSKTGFFYNLT